jgi:hypothetical protein
LRPTKTKTWSILAIDESGVLNTGGHDFAAKKGICRLVGKVLLSAFKLDVHWQPIDH